MGERVIVVAGGSGGKSVVAVDKATGTIAWAAGDDTAEFASPIPAELGDVAQVVGITDHTVTGFDPATGTRLWSAPGNEGRNISPTPVLIGADRVLAPGWWRSTALRIERAEGGLAAREEWQTTDLKGTCLLYTSPSPRDRTRSRMPSSA